MRHLPPAVAKPRAEEVLIGIDTGGTFTDVVYVHGKRVGIYKVPSTPDDPTRAVVAALDHLFPSQLADRVTYGTTVATNALLERTGARTGLVTTAGFEDVLEIGRQARPRLFELEPRKPVALVPAELRLGVRERVLHDGTVHEALDPGEFERLAAHWKRERVESVAVCLLHSPSNPVHELSIERGLAGLGVPITVSHRLSPVAGEYERTSTCVVNAYLQPKMAGHLERLSAQARAKVLRVMQSSGGAIGIATARQEPIRTMLSGPAGGVIAARGCASGARVRRFVTFDMGGTSTDVALLDGRIPWRLQTDFDGMPVRTPSIDIHTVGAGGGSIARIDEGGALKVGPESAGAEPGPACYGKGTEPTVTDANLVLGRLRPEAFLGGTMPLDAGRARRAITGLAAAAGLTTEQAAEGIVRVVEANMERAARVITVERGQDPRTCVLIAFGGAAGLHACGLAENLGIRQILVPPHPGLFSAQGVLSGSVSLERATAVRLKDPPLRDLRRIAAALVAEVQVRMREELESEGPCRISTSLRVRYLGQSLELDIPLTAGFRRAFDREHARRFRSCDRSRSIEVCGVRVSATGPTLGLATIGQANPAPSARVSRQESIYVDGAFHRVPVFARSLLGQQARLSGPAVVTEYSATFLLAPGWTARTDARGNLRVLHGKG
jgi:N-methylhydantoinase A